MTKSRMGKRKNILIFNAYFCQLGCLKSKLGKKCVRDISKKSRFCKLL